MCYLAIVCAGQVTGAAPLVALGGSIHMKMTLGMNNSSEELYATANQAVSEAVSSIRVIQVGGPRLPTC